MVRRQRIPDAYTTTLDGGVDDSTTTWTVDDGSGFPSEGDFYLGRGSEVVLCTHRSGDSLTVVRGQSGTTATSHSSGQTVKVTITAEALEQSAIEVGRLQAVPYGRLIDANGNTLDASDFTLINGASSTANDGNDGIVYLDCEVHSGNDVTGMTRTFGSGDGDIAIVTHISCPLMDISADDRISFMQRQATGGNLSGIQLDPEASIGVVERSTFLANPSALGTLRGSWGMTGFFGRLEIRWNFSGSSDQLRWYYSFDGVHWWLDATELFASSSMQVGVWGTVRTIANTRFQINAWQEVAL